MPIFSTKNGLDVTWRSIPSTLHDLSIKELDTIGLTQIFNVIEGLSTGGTGPDQMNKTLLLPLLKGSFTEVNNCQWLPWVPRQGKK